MTSFKFRALTHDDRKLFFEALGEHGKDFQNIQQYMTQKSGKGNNKSTEQSKSSDPQEKREQDKKEDDKKREQIRSFYNKLYTRLSKLIGKLDDRVEKINQELYLLINYGEIWKKFGFKFNNKTKKLLEELVHQGYTTLRSKNKNVRLRTPPCKALKKINEIGVDEKVKVVTTRELPKDVIVEFHPATMRDWLKIQSMSQNPLVRAKLSIQKRVSILLKFLEDKWNISPDKLHRAVDTWLKVPPNNLSLEDIPHSQQQYPSSNHSSSESINTNGHLRTENQINQSIGVAVEQNHHTTGNEIHARLRLKPSAQHELNEVNITRVVPDNLLDLSLSAYIKRLGESSSKGDEAANSKNNSKEISSHMNLSHNISSDGMLVDNLDLSQGGMSSSSRLPISLTTPDCSILLERSSTSEQPSIAQARKHLNILQTLAGSFEGCENSRTACEETQDRSNLALFDEDAVIVPPVPNKNTQEMIAESHQDSIQQQITDSQDKSVDFHIPKNVTLGAWLGMNENNGGDDANDAFPANRTSDQAAGNAEDSSEEDMNESSKNKAETINENVVKQQNRMIAIQKLAEGWTRRDDSSMTIGELYLAFKCPEKITLEYEFEQFTPSNNTTSQTSAIVSETSSNRALIFGLLTAASLSLAQIDRSREEQKRIEQTGDTTGSKLKRRKGPSNVKGGQIMTPHDIEARNQRVEEALRMLQPTRLSVFRRAR